MGNGTSVTDLSERRVLIVDDTRANVDLLVSALKGEYRLSVALSGEAALRLVEKSPPDLILLDVVMPGLDGFEVCRRLRENKATRDVPVMFLTALDEVAIKTQAFEMGGTDYVTKPFEMLEVKARVRSLLKAKAYNDAFREMVASELRIARDIQLGALPQDFSALAAGTGLEVHAVMEPAREVGGDLFEVLRLPGGRLFAALGDVSGKGVPAAMFMMVTIALVRVAAREGLDMPQLLARLNEQLCADNPTSMFVTLACAAVDGVSGTLRYATAGHTAPVLLGAGGEARFLDGPPGTIAGVQSGLEFPSAGLELAPGDTFVLYSDGVTEAFDPDGKAFGEAGLLAALQGLRAGSAREVVERLLQAVRTFAGPAETSDDIAILAVRRAPAPPLVLEVGADRLAVVRATDRLRAWCTAAGIPVDATHDLALALEEAGINVVVHGLRGRPGASFHVRLSRGPGEAVLEVRDAGPAFNPLETAPPVMAESHEDQPLGGLGIHLVKSVMTRATWVREGEENVLTLTRVFAGERAG